MPLDVWFISCFLSWFRVHRNLLISVELLTEVSQKEQHGPAPSGPGPWPVMFTLLMGNSWIDLLVFDISLVSSGDVSLPPRDGCTSKCWWNQVSKPGKLRGDFGWSLRKQRGGWLGNGMVLCPTLLVSFPSRYLLFLNVFFFMLH